MHPIVKQIGPDLLNLNQSDGVWEQTKVNTSDSDGTSQSRVMSKKKHVMKRS